MQEEFEKIKKIFGDVHIQPVSYARTGIKPARDWFILLSMTCIMTIIVALGAYWLYAEIDAGTLFPVSTETVSAKATINQTLLKKTIDTLDAHQSTAATLDAIKTAPADPSL